jgi:hypothetical protein
MAKKKPAGVGALGKGMTRFFHPRAKIKEKWPMPPRGHVQENVVIIGKETHRINKRDILSYRVRLPEIDDGSEFFIVCRNISVTATGARPFDDEAPPEGTVQRQATTSSADPLRGQFENVSNNIGRRASAQDIAELREAGITVDNEDPAPENVGAPPSDPLFNVGEWMKPTICPRRADSTVHDLNGNWKQILGRRWGRCLSWNSSVWHFRRSG